MSLATTENARHKDIKAFISARRTICIIQWLKDALEAGKHVVCEKTIGHILCRPGEELCETGQRIKEGLQCGWHFNIRYYPLMQARSKCIG